MATVDTPNLTLAKPSVSDLGWGTSLNTLFDRLDTLLGGNITSAADPNGTVEGYQNQLISDADGVTWFCTTTGDAATAVWKRLADLTFVELSEAASRRVWAGSVEGKWQAASVDSSGNLTMTLQQQFLYHVLTKNIEIKHPPTAPTPSADDLVVQSVMLRLYQPDPGFTVSWESGFFRNIGGTSFTITPNTYAYFTFFKEPNRDIWTVFPSLGYPGSI